MVNFDYVFSEIAGDPLVVNLALAKKNSVIEADDTDQDDLLTLKLKGAIAAVEMYTERVYQPKQVAIGLSGLQSKITFPETPIKEIEQITYEDEAGDVQVIPSDKYKLYSYQGGKVQRLVFLDYEFPVLNALNEFPVTVQAIFGESEVPTDVVNAVLLMFSESEMYRENRPQNMVNTAAVNLLRPHRKYS